jgi:hypothetical protein
MSDRKAFGLWTLFAAVAWIAGLVAAGIVIWRLWTDWSPR